MNRSSILNPIGCVVLILTTFTPSLYAQAPDTLWTKIYGQIFHDRGFSVQQTSDGGYIVTGYTGSGDWLAKTDANGDTLWTRAYHYNGFNNSVQQTSDGGYIVCGARTVQINPWVYERNIYVLRTDSLGSVVWGRSYDQYIGDEGFVAGEEAYETSDGNYIVIGYRLTVGRLLKLNPQGDTIWTQSYYGNYLHSGKQTPDGGYILAGSRHHFQALLQKTDSLGGTLWERLYGGLGNEAAYSTQQTSDGGYIIAGVTTSFGTGDADVYLLKTDSLGDTLWSKAYGGTGFDEGHSVQQTSDGGYIVAGLTESFGAGYRDVYLLRTDSLGDTLWSKTLGGWAEDIGYSVQQTFDGGYIVAGMSASFGFGNGYDDVWLIRLEPDVGIEGQQIGYLKNSAVSATIFHGPLQLPEDKKCKVFDITGRAVAPDKIQPGIYFIEVDGVVTQKVVKVR